MRTEGVGPSQFPLEPFSGKSISKGTPKTSFKETLDTFLNDVNKMQSASSAAQRKLLAGEVTDVHQVMNKSEEAKVAFNMIVEIRNKVLEAYNEIMRLRM
ncbi:MAG: flagellar hook-basal body complex protein FliE [Fibrobacterota bacterium]